MDLKFMISVIYFGDVLLQLLLFKLILGYLGYTADKPLFFLADHWKDKFLLNIQNIQKKLGQRVKFIIFIFKIW